jgi:hypothetical protein
MDSMVFTFLVGKNSRSRSADSPNKLLTANKIAG